jgi:hypothetical protein
MNKDYSEDREPLDTMGMLESAFIKNLANPDLKNKIATAKANVPIKETAKNYNTENLLMSLYEVRDDLIESFKEIDLDSNLSQSVSSNINRLGACIKQLGGEADTFDPLNYLSGLQNPSIVKSAERVIETTKQCYALGKIEDCKVEDAGKTIVLTFAGERNGMIYKAIGTITASKSWVGNEAIDYLYKAGSGKMFVKAYVDGKWSDKSNDYSIAWELEEMPVTEIKEGNTANNNKIKEGNNKTVENKIDNEINDDFPIAEVAPFKDEEI